MPRLGMKIDRYEEFNISHSENGGQGFRLTFPNNWTISCVWGPGHYASHHHHHDWNSRLPRAGSKLKPYKGQWDGGIDGQGWSSDTAEVAVWDVNRTYYVWDREDMAFAHNNLFVPFFEAHSYDMDRDAVEGYVSVQEVGHLIWLVMKQEPVEKMCRFDGNLYKVS